MAEHKEMEGPRGGIRCRVCNSRATVRGQFDEIILAGECRWKKSSSKITDKIRLDWLEKNKAEVNSDSSDPVEAFCVERKRTASEYSPVFHWIDFGWHKTLRAAIDAGILYDRSKKKDKK